MQSIADIKQQLSAIPDPEIPVITIDELGVLRDVSYEEEKLVVTITPTYSGCPAMDRFQADIKEELAKMNIEQFEIKMQYDPPWTTDWIGRRRKKNYAFMVLPLLLLKHPIKMPYWAHRKKWIVPTVRPRKQNWLVLLAQPHVKRCTGVLRV